MAMATCPRCDGFLDGGHKCRLVASRLWRRWTAVAVIGLIAGSLIAINYAGPAWLEMLPVTVALMVGVTDAVAREAFLV
jgi:hypothetical protein